MLQFRPKPDCLKVNLGHLRNMAMAIVYNKLSGYGLNYILSNWAKNYEAGSILTAVGLQVTRMECLNCRSATNFMAELL